MGHPKSKAYRRFRKRLAYFAERTRGAGWLHPHFIRKPHFDELLGRPSGYTEYLVEEICEIFYFVIDRKAQYGAKRNQFADRPNGENVIPFRPRREQRKFVALPDRKAA